MIFSGSGFVFYGGMIGGLLGAYLVSRWYRIGSRRDDGHVRAGARDRAGDWAGLDASLSGDGDWGLPSTLPWAMAYPKAIVGWNPQTVLKLDDHYSWYPLLRLADSPGVRVHPAPVYEAILYLGVFVILWSMRKTRSGGTHHVSGTCCWEGPRALSSSSCESIRESSMVLSEAQLIALAMMIVGAIALVTHRGKGQAMTVSRPANGRSTGQGRASSLIIDGVKEQDSLRCRGGIVVVIGLALVAITGHRGTRSRIRVASSADSEAPVAAGSQAANFKLEALDGHTVSLESLRGKVVFLNVWATWCGPCREEMPSMETLYEDFKDNKDFVMLAVSQDTKGRSVVAPYVAKNGYQFTILLDPENKVSETYDVSGVPETFIIDRKGQIVAHHMGAFDWSRPDVKDALQQLLDSKEG